MLAELWRGAAREVGKHGRARGGLLAAVVRRPAATPAVVDRRVREDPGGARKGLVKASASACLRRWRRRSSKAEPSRRTRPDDPSAGEAFIATEENEAAEAAGALAASVAEPRARRRDAGACAQARASAGRARSAARRVDPPSHDGRGPVERAAAGPLHRIRGHAALARSPTRRSARRPEPDDRIASFTGATSTERREELKRRFNADPAEEPLRILICTDAAREGINLQMRCHDLIHVDLPWNPARLEQRNGRIDRKLQPSPQVWCRYFVYEQRPEDVVLQALVRKTERIREQLGSAGQVIGQRLSERLEREGIWRAQAQAREIDEAADERLERRPSPRWTTRRRPDARVRPRNSTSCASCARSRASGSASIPTMLEKVVAEALARAGASLEAARAGEINGVALFRLDPDDPAFVGGGWAEALDDLQNPPPQAVGDAEGLARRCAAARRLVPPRADRRRRRRRGRPSAPSRASAGAPAAVALPEPGLRLRPVARLGRHRAGRAAACRPARPAGALWAGRGAAA